jgi:hypothetical protein
MGVAPDFSPGKRAFKPARMLGTKIHGFSPGGCFWGGLHRQKPSAFDNLVANCNLQPLWIPFDWRPIPRNETYGFEIVRIPRRLNLDTAIPRISIPQKIGLVGPLPHGVERRLLKLRRAGNDSQVFYISICANHGVEYDLP